MNFAEAGLANFRFLCDEKNRVCLEFESNGYPGKKDLNNTKDVHGEHCLKIIAIICFYSKNNCFSFLSLSLKPKIMNEIQHKLVVFQEKGIRRIWYNGEWFFSVLDIVEVLADTNNPTDYFKKMRKRDDQLKAFVGTNCPQVEMEGREGKKRKTLAANIESIFRIIQSIPSPKAEPFKQWLAKVGYERIQEIENPELAAERARQYYKDLGYSEDWIAKRLQSIEIRGKLTDEWKSRDVKEGLEYAILTAEISKATFGLVPSEYMKLKDLKRENLRDHMTDLELIFTMLGETATRNEALNRNAKGFDENKEAAKEGGAAAGDALDAFEKRTGSKVVSEKNFKQQIAEAKKQKRLTDEK